MLRWLHTSAANVVQRSTESLKPRHFLQVVALKAHHGLQEMLVWSITSRPPSNLRFDKPSKGRQAEIVSRQVISVRQGIWCRQRDQLVAEEPMEIQVGGPDQDMISLAVTMRTPGHDAELAIGFLYAEGLIGSHDDIMAIHAGETLRRSVIPVTLSRCGWLDPSISQP